MGFEDIYKKYWQKVFRICMGYINDHDAAKDLAQETFVKVWTHLSTFKNESTIGTWIYRITVNTCLRQIQKEKKMPKSRFADEIKDVIVESGSNSESEIDFLYQCISKLPEIERVIISLELEEVQQKEIAKIVGISEGNVRVKIHRIKEKLTQKFKENG